MGVLLGLKEDDIISVYGVVMLSYILSNRNGLVMIYIPLTPISQCSMLNVLSVITHPVFISGSLGIVMYLQ